MSGNCLSALIESGPLIERYTPLSRSRIWMLNTAYWEARGASAFMQDAVPYVATNDGSLSAATAEVVAAYARDLETPRQLSVVEIGPGTGIFARILISRYAQLRSGDDTLPPMRYVFVDSSASILAGLKDVLTMEGADCEVSFIRHNPSEGAGFRAALERELAPGEAAACVCNYAFDSLPGTVVKRRRQMLGETEVELRLLPDAHEDEVGLRRRVVVRARGGEERFDGPGAAIAARFLTEEGMEVPLNLGALRCLEFLASAEERVGLVLVNDYEVEAGMNFFEPVQYFAGSFALGLHFGILDAYVSEELGWSVTQPRRPAGAFVSRMYGAPLSPELCERYAEVFSFAETKRAHELVGVARQAQSDGRLGGALSAYEQALEGNETNWSLLTEVAGFLFHRLGRVNEALELTREAFAINPLCVEALDVAGECHFRMGEIQAAREAFERMLEIRPADARALLNIAYCDAREGELARALRHIAEAMSADVDDSLTGELLERQRELIQQVQKGGGAAGNS